LKQGALEGESPVYDWDFI